MRDPNHLGAMHVNLFVDDPFCIAGIIIKSPLGKGVSLDSSNKKVSSPTRYL